MAAAAEREGAAGDALGQLGAAHAAVEGENRGAGLGRMGEGEGESLGAAYRISRGPLGVSRQMRSMAVGREGRG